MVPVGGCGSQVTDTLYLGLATGAPVPTTALTPAC